MLYLSNKGLFTIYTCTLTCMYTVYKPSSFPLKMLTFLCSSCAGWVWSITDPASNDTFTFSLQIFLSITDAIIEKVNTMTNDLDRVS